MSKKLTKEMLDALIKEAMLQERKLNIKFPVTFKDFDTDKAKAQIGISSSDLDKLSGEDGDGRDLTYNDFAQAAAKKSSEFKKLKDKGEDPYKDAAKKVDAVVKALPSKDKASAIDLTQKIDFAKSKSIAFKTMNTISADPDDSTAMGSFPEGIATATQTFFADRNSLFTRIEKINEFYDKIYSNPSKGLQKDRLVNIFEEYGEKYSELLSGVIFADYLSTLVQETDSGAAAYNFEALLAMMSGGRVKGKDTTAAGKMGVTDFVTNKGIKGSAKYYANYSGIEQSAKGFELNEPIFYIIALKMTSGAGTTKPTGAGGDPGAGPVSDPRKIKELHVYNMVIMKTAEKTVGSTTTYDFVLKDGANQYHEIKNVGSKLKINKVGYYKNPAVLKVGRKSENFQNTLLRNMNKTINKGADDAEKKVGIVVQQMNIALENSQEATQKITAYASSGKKTTGNAAVKALKQAEAATKELALKGYKHDITENKMKELDLMVENMVKQFIKGNLND